MIIIAMLKRDINRVSMNVFQFGDKIYPQKCITNNISQDGDHKGYDENIPITQKPIIIFMSNIIVRYNAKGIRC